MTEQKLKPRLTAAVLVQKDDKFLLAERNKVNANGMWIIPGGGVKFGETTEQAAIREIKEETNLEVHIKKFIGFNEVINVPGNYHSIVFFYLAEPKHDNIQAKEDVSQAQYFTIDEIKKLNIVKSVEWALREASFW